MRLLRRDDYGEFTLAADLAGEDTVPPYAILSHTWGADEEEITFEDLTNKTGHAKSGYDKIRFCGEQARLDGLQYFWIDTCCINKANKAEFSHAINSMCRWYQNATKCYVYLSDVSTSKIEADGKLTEITWEQVFRTSRWFTRGWTLQELLAPHTVEFFSKEGNKLGDKMSLQQHIHEITGIPVPALQGVALIQFSVNMRLSWIEHRQTKHEEDKAYSLLGIFGVYISPMYGEGIGGALRRLDDEIRKLGNCLRDIRLPDPRDDKKRIEDTKGGLLEDAYNWVLENPSFKQWYDNLQGQQGQQGQLLWIKGDPGKGKTMLLCGIINELQKSMAKTDILSYFFCQATDSRINSATAVLRGLLYLLVSQQPLLVSHVRKKYDDAGKSMFEDVNAWIALSEIFTSVLRDPDLSTTTYLIIDALDECVTDLPRLLNFVAMHSSSTSPRVKWIISSRNWPDTEEQLEQAGHKVRLSLELNAESVSTAVSVFIKQKVSQLAQQKKYNKQTQDTVLQHLESNANNTFLWVALVCQNLRETPKRNALKKLESFPPGLDSLYERMMQQIRRSDDAERCRQVLASIALMYQPITLDELVALIEQFEDIANDLESIQEIISVCGSFLTLQGGIIYFVHQSAKDFLHERAAEVFPSGKEVVHYNIFARSLKVLSKTLRRDMYSLSAPGYAAEQVEQLDLDPDPLAAIRYSSVYWIDHLSEWSVSSSACSLVDLQDGGDVYQFLRKCYLYWLEAPSLCKSMSKGVTSMKTLETLAQGRTYQSAFKELVQDSLCLTS